MARVVQFEAQWDDEAQVWWAAAIGDLGIATESETVEGLRERLRLIVPDFLETSDEVRIDVTFTVSDTVKAA